MYVCVSNEVICLIRMNRLYRSMSDFFTFDSLLDLKMNGMECIYNLELYCQGRLVIPLANWSQNHSICHFLDTTNVRFYEQNCLLNLIINRPDYT